MKKPKSLPHEMDFASSKIIASKSSERNMKVSLLFFLLLAIVSLILGAIIDQISISYQEAEHFFYENDYVVAFSRLFIELFGQNDFALRLPFLAIHLCNISLIFAISKLYLKKPMDALLCATIYALIPGINITAILFSKSVLILFFALLLCYLYLKRYNPAFFTLCILGSLIDSSFSVIFLALFFYAMRFQHNKTLLFALLGFSINMYHFKLPIGGIPDGHFLDTLGLLALLYSPILFIYYIYTLYRGVVKKENSLMLYIAITSILFSLLLSLRQGIDFFSFLPLSFVGIPIMVKDCLHNIRLRLPVFRIAYTRRFYLILIPLILESLFLFGNKLLFFFEPQRHFLSNFYFAKELAWQLQERGIHSLKTETKLQNQLRFYGISSSKTPVLYEAKNGEIKIIYLNKKAKAFSTK